MNRDMEGAFADEVLAEIAAQKKSRGLNAKEMQRLTGITSSTWGNYFVQRTTRIPFGAMLAVSEALGVLPEDMIARARVRAERNATEEPDELEAGLSADGRRVLREQRDRFGVPGEVADPFVPARADVDDGSITRSATA